MDKMTLLGFIGFLFFTVVIPVLIEIFTPYSGIIVGILLGVTYLAMGIRVIFEYDRGLLFVFGKYRRIVGPGLVLVFPFIEIIKKITLRVQVADVPPQETISRDNIPLVINAVGYYKVDHPKKQLLKLRITDKQLFR